MAAPPSLYVGSDSFTYEVTNGVNTAIGTVTLTIVAPPILAVDDSGTTQTSTPITINVLGNDVGAGLAIISIANPPNGSASASAGGILYSADALFVGDDTFAYTIRDSYGQTDIGSITITVNADPPPPVQARDDIASATSGVALTISPLGNDVSALPLTIASTTTPAHGSATRTNGNTQVIYTATSPYVGADSFDYVATDGSASDTGTVAITVTAPALTAIDDSASTTTVTPVTISALANDVGSGKFVSAVADPPHGTAIRVNSNTQVQYTADALFTGDDVFNYTVQDAFGQTDTGQITVTVAPVAVDPVVAVDDFATVASGATVVISVLNNDTGTGLSISAVSDPPHGTATRITANTQIQYVSDANYAGSDSCTYTMTDGLTSDVGAISITVDPLPIDAITDSAAVQQGTSATASPLANDIGAGLILQNVGIATVTISGPDSAIVAGFDSGLPWSSGATPGTSSIASWGTMRNRNVDCTVVFPGETLGDPLNSGWNGEYATWPTNGAWNARLTNALAAVDTVVITIPLMNYTDRDDFAHVATCPDTDELIVAHTAIANKINTAIGTRTVYLRLGHEANAGNNADVESRPDASPYRYPWHFLSQAGVFATPADYIAAWARIANLYKTIIGSTQAKLVWNLVWQHDTYLRLGRYYPGDSVVDVIGLDIYDNGNFYVINSDANWLRTLGDYAAGVNGGSARGLDGVLAFANLHSKQVSLDEWAPLNGTDDTNPVNNSFFPGHLFSWLSSNASSIAFEAYFNSAATHQIAPTAPRLPLSRAAYIAAWAPPA
jgi:hypothetical protein